jgi:hypothetical protein
MRKCTRLLVVYTTSGLLLFGSALPARAIDIVPFAGFRFGGDLGTQPGNGVVGPTSLNRTRLNSITATSRPSCPALRRSVM